MKNDAKLMMYQTKPLKLLPPDREIDTHFGQQNR